MKISSLQVNKYHSLRAKKIYKDTINNIIGYLVLITVLSVIGLIFLLPVFYTALILLLGVFIMEGCALIACELIELNYRKQNNIPIDSE